MSDSDSDLFASAALSIPEDEENPNANATATAAATATAVDDSESGDIDDSDVISSSESDGADFHLLSALSSQTGATAEKTITSAELLDELILAWSNEKLCPDLLPYREDLVECVRDQLDGIERQLKQRGGGSAPKDLASYLHKVEVSRARYLVTDLLRCRLGKVHAFSEAMMSQAATIDANGNSRWAGRLSPAEAEFAKDFVASQHRHFERLALAKMPQFLTRPPHPLEAPRPNLDAFVFFRVCGGGGANQTAADQSGMMNDQPQQQMIVRPAREAEAVQLKAGEQHLMQYAPIERLLLDDKVQLI